MTRTLTDAAHDVLVRLATAESGWASLPELMFNLEPDDTRARSAVRRQLVSLAHDGSLEAITCRHRSEGMLMLNVEQHRIEELLAGGR